MKRNEIKKFPGVYLKSEYFTTVYHSMQPKLAYIFAMQTNHITRVLDINKAYSQLLQVFNVDITLLIIFAAKK